MAEPDRERSRIPDNYHPQLSTAEPGPLRLRLRSGLLRLLRLTLHLHNMYMCPQSRRLLQYSRSAVAPPPPSPRLDREVDMAGINARYTCSQPNERR